MSWTPERIAALKRLHAEGWSNSKIAVALGGVTRNAVIGKAHRLGLPRRKDEVTIRITGTPRPLPSVARPKARQWNSYPDIFETVEGVLKKPRSKKLQIATLTSTSCKWPHGDPKSNDFHFCGHDVVLGRVYCLYHCRISYQVPKPRPSRAYHRTHR